MQPVAQRCSAQQNSWEDMNYFLLVMFAGVSKKTKQAYLKISDYKLFQLVGRLNDGKTFSNQFVLSLKR